MAITEGRGYQAELSYGVTLSALLSPLLLAGELARMPPVTHGFRILLIFY